MGELRAGGSPGRDFFWGGGMGWGFGVVSLDRVGERVGRGVAVWEIANAQRTRGKDAVSFAGGSVRSRSRRGPRI